MKNQKIKLSVKINQVIKKNYSKEKSNKIFNNNRQILLTASIIEKQRSSLSCFVSLPLFNIILAETNTHTVIHRLLVELIHTVKWQ